MVVENSNIIHIEQWKTEKKENSFCDYLKVLNFNDLINESNALISEIKNQKPGQDLVSKTKLMMNEFATRLEKESKHLADSVIDLTKSIDKKDK